MNIKSQLAKFINTVTSDEWCGNQAMPNSASSTGWVEEVDHNLDYLATFKNDASEVWIAWRDAGRPRDSEQWKLSMRAETFRKIAVWYLLRWSWGEWFGMKRRLWYWALSVRVAEHKQAIGSIW